MGFEQDHFSRRAEGYARARPGYPDALYDALATLAPGRTLAWDCATGSGQAAVPLGDRFEHVFASDASPQQLAHRFRHPRVHYAIARAERAPLRDAAADLVTVAAAVHWFELDAFYAEALRVLRPGGALAVWGYLESRVDPAVDRIMKTYIHETLKADWPERMQYGLAGYRTLPFPLPRVALPPFDSVLHWTLHELRAFIETWSGTQRYQARTGRDPLDDLGPRLAEAWGDPERVREVRWPLMVLAGRKPA